ncbi:MAG: ParA family protein [Nitrospinales bacterium]
MKTLVLFNNKGGVGKTTLVYHLAHMFSRMDFRTLAVDLDPQANLTSAFLDEDRVEELWDPDDGGDTILGCLNPILVGEGGVAEPSLEEIRDRLWILPGHLGLSRFEDKLSESWPKVYNEDIAALKTTTAFYRIILKASKQVNADVTLIDVGPNLGAINRSAILAADYLLVPLAADLFSLQGLRNLGPTVRKWRSQWQDMKEKVPDEIEIPSGTMKPIGYLVVQHEVRKDRPVKAFLRWADRIPGVYSKDVLSEKDSRSSIAEDPNCLIQLKNFKSLMPMAQDARKPMFELKSADGAIGGHVRFVADCYDEFEKLARKVLQKIGLEICQPKEP